MRFSFGFIFLFVALILSACSSGPSESEFAPKIGDIYTTIKHFHPDAYAHKPTEERRTIGFIISVSVTDPDGLDDITGIYIYDKTHNSYFKLVDKSVLNQEADCRQTEEVIECSFYSKDRPDFLNLGGYELVAVDRHSYTTRKSFEFKLPAGLVVDDEEFVYSDVFADDPDNDVTNGIKGLEVMTVANNGLEFSLNNEGGTIDLKFEAKDDRVTAYGLALYDNAEIPNLVGEISFKSPTLQSAPIVLGQETVVDIPWNEIDFQDGYDVSNLTSSLYGLYVILFDESTVSTQFEVQKAWFNYSGTSEFITQAVD